MTQTGLVHRHGVGALSLAELGAVPNGHGPMKLVVMDASQAKRLLIQVADGQVTPSKLNRVVLAVAEWIGRQEVERADQLVGVMRLLGDAAQRVGAAERK